MKAWKVIKTGDISFIKQGVNVGFHLEPGDIIFTDVCGQVEVKTDKYPYKSQICDCIRLCKIVHYEHDEVQIYENVNFIYPRISGESILSTVGKNIEKAIDWQREEKLKAILN